MTCSLLLSTSRLLLVHFLSFPLVAFKIILLIIKHHLVNLSSLSDNIALEHTAIVERCSAARGRSFYFTPGAGSGYSNINSSQKVRTLFYWIFLENVLNSVN